MVDTYPNYIWLVVGSPTHLKHVRVSQIGSIFPKIRDENKPYLKAPAR